MPNLKKFRKLIFGLLAATSITASNPALAKHINKEQKEMVSKQRIKKDLKNYNNIAQDLEKIRKNRLEYVRNENKVIDELSNVRKEIYLSNISEEGKKELLNLLVSVEIDLEIYTVRYRIDEIHNLISKGKYDEANKYLEFINQGISHLEGMTNDKKLIKNLRTEEIIARNTLKNKQK